MNILLEVLSNKLDTRQKRGRKFDVRCESIISFQSTDFKNVNIRVSCFCLKSKTKTIGQFADKHKAVKK